MRSLEKQLPLASFILLTLVAASITLAAYGEARSSARDLFGERLTRLSDQLAGTIGANLTRVQSMLVDVAADPAIARLLAESDDEGARAAASAALGRVVSAQQPALAVGVWNLAGDLVLAGSGGEVEWLVAPPLVQELTVTPVEALDDSTVHYGIVVPVREARMLVGFVQLRQRLTRGTIAPAVEAVLGETGMILLGSPGGAWSDLTRRVASPPPEVVGAGAAFAYERAGERRLGVGRAVAGTSLSVLSEVSERAALASTRAFAARVGAFATLLVTLATAAAWLLGKRITGPLAQLRATAEGLGQGDYGRRAPVAGHPEIADVARAFNTMATDTEKHVAALRSSEERFRSLVTATAQIVWWTDPQGSITEPLPLWQAYTGLDFDQIRGAGWTSALHPDDAADALRVWKEAVARRSLFETEFRIRRHDGVYRWFVMRAVPIVESDDRIREWVATCTDVTSRRETEEKLQAKELELQRSQRLDAVGRLAGGIAHDFNNLSSAILGPAELASQSIPADHAAQADLKDIRNAARRAGDLTRKLLTFGRQQVMTPVVLDLNEAVQSATRLLERLIGEAVIMDVALRARASTVRVDRTNLEQIIVNLAVNARDAMPDGGHLTIETADADVDVEMAESHGGLKPGRYVALVVTDTGNGMDAETQKRIFEPFFTTKSSEKGTGLGLSIVYGIVRQSGGDIWAYSEPGMGTSFKILLPMVEDSVTAVPAVPDERAVPGGRETILLAEDEEAIRRIAQRILAQLGYTVLPAKNGEEALLLAASQQGEIHMLLSDVVMPKMNGLELWERLRVARPNLPVLFLSGWATDAVVRHGLLDGQLPFLQKPFTSQQLGLKVREVLDGGRSAA